MKRSKKTITSAALLASPRALEMAVAFLNEVVGQIPEKPDYWCACGQCDHNIDKADDIIDEVLAQNAPLERCAVAHTLRGVVGSSVGGDK